MILQQHLKVRFLDAPAITIGSLPILGEMFCFQVMNNLDETPIKVCGGGVISKT